MDDNERRAVARRLRRQPPHSCLLRYCFPSERAAERPHRFCDPDCLRVISRALIDARRGSLSGGAGGRSGGTEGEAGDDESKPKADDWSDDDTMDRYSYSNGDPAVVTSLFQENQFPDPVARIWADRQLCGAEERCIRVQAGTCGRQA